MTSPPRHIPTASRPCKTGVFAALTLVASTLFAPLAHAQNESPTTAPAPIAAPARPDLTPPDPDKLKIAIQSGLDWLARQQITSGPEAGSWGGGTSPPLVTSLIGLAFLAHGHQPGEGRYGKNLDAAIDYIQRSMTPEGYIGSRGNSMYAHAVCTLFALSYLGQSPSADREAQLGPWCRRAIDVIIQAQRVRKSPAEQGGWRYTPDSNESDLSVTSWQLLALHAARQCGYDVDQQVFDDALRYINNGAREVDGALGFLYRPGMSKDAEPDVTGATVAVKTLIETPVSPTLFSTLGLLNRFPPMWGGVQYKGFYYSFNFYMVQGYFQLGPREWSQYGPAIKRILVERQSGDGRWPFPPDGDQENRASGYPYATAMALLILGADNQFIPIFQRQHEIFGNTR